MHKSEEEEEDISIYIGPGYNDDVRGRARLGEEKRERRNKELGSSEGRREAVRILLRPISSRSNIRQRRRAFAFPPPPLSHTRGIPKLFKAYIHPRKGHAWCQRACLGRSILIPFRSLLCVLSKELAH